MLQQFEIAVIAILRFGHLRGSPNPSAGGMPVEFGKLDATVTKAAAADRSLEPQLSP